MTDVRRRRGPLRVDRTAADVSAPSPAIEHTNPAQERTDEDRRAFADAVGSLRTGGGSLGLSERTLMVAGGILAPIGFLVVLLGWVGASRTPYLFEQVPYLISGGLLGLALVFLGAFMYFAHWVTELVKEHRTQSAALLDAIGQLRDEIAIRGAVTVTAVTHDGASGASGAAALAPVALVATSRGSMAHRADCVVVAGKDDLRAVTDVDGLGPCKLCDPFADSPSVN